jgi:hypothetical protein
MIDFDEEVVDKFMKGQWLVTDTMGLLSTLTTCFFSQGSDEIQCDREVSRDRFGHSCNAFMHLYDGDRVHCVSCVISREKAKTIEGNSYYDRYYMIIILSDINFNSMDVIISASYEDHVLIDDRRGVDFTIQLHSGEYLTLMMAIAISITIRVRVRVRVRIWITIDITITITVTITLRIDINIIFDILQISSTIHHTDIPSSGCCNHLR